MERELTRVPFAVELASYCIQFHDNNRCSKCSDEGCPRLDAAHVTRDKYRAERLERYRLRRRD